MKENKIILLVVSSERAPEVSSTTAIKLAAEKNCSLHILYVIEEWGLKYLNRMSESELIGKKISTELAESLIREKRQHAYTVIERITENAKKQNVNVKSTILTGDIIELSLKISKELSPLEIIISMQKEGYLQKILRGNPVDILKKSTGIPVTAINE